MHLHTNVCSACARVGIEALIDNYISLGYSGFVVTNHFYHGNSAIDRSLPQKEFIKAYTDDYYKGLEYSKDKNFTVLFGLEEGYGNGKEMLIYGVEPEIFLNSPDFIEMSLKEKYNFVKSNGGITVCAHPFRDRFYITNPDQEPDLSMFDGIEVYNYGNTEQENHKALEFASNNPQKIVTCGGDIHNIDNRISGMEFYNKITDNKELITELKSNNYKLLLPSKER